MTPNGKAVCPIKVAASGKTALAKQNHRKKNTLSRADNQPEKLLAALRVASVTTPAAIYDMKIPHPAGAVHDVGAGQ
jgi:hypothetical protein